MRQQARYASKFRTRSCRSIGLLLRPQPVAAGLLRAERSRLIARDSRAQHSRFAHQVAGLRPLTIGTCHTAYCFGSRIESMA
jgi:hypothetical protein